MKQQLENFFNGYTQREPVDKLYLQFKQWFEFNGFKCQLPTIEKFTKSYNLYLKKIKPDKPIEIRTVYSDRIETRNADGLLHSFNGKPSVEWTGSYKARTKEWHYNGIRHRTKGPAVEKYDGTKVWIVNGRRHNLDGPAVINSPRGERKHYIDDKFVPTKDFCAMYD